ncbi:MAG: type VI secretion system lipoprotein TssJ [Pseudomonadota bacterium]
MPAKPNPGKPTPDRRIAGSPKARPAADPHRRHRALDRLSPRALTGAIALGIAGMAVLVGCTPEPVPPTDVALNIEGTASMNGGAPAQAKVYYLTSTANFEAGDFFALFNDPRGTLGTDVLQVDEYLLSPGASVQDTKVFSPALAPTAIGVVAGFRDIDQPGWRTTAPLTPNGPNAVTVVLDGSTVSVAQ